MSFALITKTTEYMFFLLFPVRFPSVIESVQTIDLGFCVNRWSMDCEGIRPPSHQIKMYLTVYVVVKTVTMSPIHCMTALLRAHE